MRFHLHLYNIRHVLFKAYIWWTYLNKPKENLSWISSKTLRRLTGSSELLTSTWFEEGGQKLIGVFIRWQRTLTLCLRGGEGGFLRNLQLAAPINFSIVAVNLRSKATRFSWAIILTQPTVKEVGVDFHILELTTFTALWKKLYLKVKPTLRFMFSCVVDPCNGCRGKLERPKIALGHHRRWHSWNVILKYVFFVEKMKIYAAKTPKRWWQHIVIRHWRLLQRKRHWDIFRYEGVSHIFLVIFAVPKKNLQRQV